MGSIPIPRILFILYYIMPFEYTKKYYKRQIEITYYHKDHFVLKEIFLHINYIRKKNRYILRIEQFFFNIEKSCVVVIMNISTKNLNEFIYMLAIYGVRPVIKDLDIEADKEKEKQEKN